MKRVLALSLLCLCLLGCGPKKPAPTTAPTEPPPPPVVVYPGAQIDYLGSIVDFSWEQEYKPEYVMLHFCSGVVLDPENPYDYDLVRSTFVDNEVSIHYLVDREGTVYCFIPENRTAWHAGVGDWLDREEYHNNLNRYSIGIEVMAIGSQADMAPYLTEAEYQALDPALIGYTDAQYAALKDLVADICQRNDIPLDRDHIIGHQEFSPHKTDPGELFDWERVVP